MKYQIVTAYVGGLYCTPVGEPFTDFNDAQDELLRLIGDKGNPYRHYWIMEV